MALSREIDPAVAAVLSRLPTRVRSRLEEMRALILDTAEVAEGVGPLLETLKWNEPAYLPKTPRTGSTVRMNSVKGSNRHYALYFHCQTGLVDQFRELYPDIFRFEGNRALIFDVAQPLPRAPLAHCIALALTYHRRKL